MCEVHLMPREATQPHGTLAAARRHYRHGEKLCLDCKQAEKRDSQDRYQKNPRKGK
jgi:hypothetical protein